MTAQPRPMVIGLCNNMPDGALQATEQQFCALLAAASPHCVIRLVLIALPAIPRGETARAHIATNYQPSSALDSLALDGLIVTGMEPRASDLTTEPFWQDFTALADWARDRHLPVLWSCLAAHAAVLHFDGITRRRRPAKASGLFAVRRRAERHEAMQGLPPHWHVPHSRVYELPEADLVASGYRILSAGDEAGVDAFASPAAPFLFLQGHPEYDREALLREYARDLRRFLGGQQTQRPAIPRDYLTPDSEETLLRLQALGEGIDATAALAEAWPSLRIRRDWRPEAALILGNWLGMAGRQAAPQDIDLALGRLIAAQGMAEMAASELAG